VALVILARINQILNKEDSLSISRYLEKSLILFLEEETREGVISRLVERLSVEGKLTDKDQFHQAILEREKIVSTGIGIGVAIPHAKMPHCSDFFIAVGIQKYRGVDWDALDGSLVRLIFMIGGPDNKQTEYLKILSHLTQSVKDEHRRKRLLRCGSESEVLDLFMGC
jgi:PTS system nitrogen regulatory IIA component